MARTWSVRLRGIAVRAGQAIAALWEQPDRAFLGLAVLAHLIISVMGALSLAVRLAHAEHAGAALFEPSVLLFLLAGASTALLLLHMSGSIAHAHFAPPATQPPDVAGNRSRQVMAAFSHSGIPIAIPQTDRPAAPLRAPAFSGLMDSVGHELRTPLNAIIGFTELMQRELQGPLGSPRYREYLGHIRDSGLALLKAAEDTMALTSLLADRERVRSEAVDLDALLDEACRSADAGKRTNSVMRGAPCVATVLAEPAALRQALSNLVATAVLRTPQDRPVSITTRVLDDSVRLCVTIASGSDPRGVASGQSIAVARMLFELQGVLLSEKRCCDGAWRITLDLPRAATDRVFTTAAVRALQRPTRLHPLAAS